MISKHKNLSQKQSVLFFGPSHIFIILIFLYEKQTWNHAPLFSTRISWCSDMKLWIVRIVSFEVVIRFVEIAFFGLFRAWLPGLDRKSGPIPTKKIRTTNIGTTDRTIADRNHDSEAQLNEVR